MPRKASGESYVWDHAKEKLFLEKLDDYLASRGGKQPTSSILELWASASGFGSVTMGGGSTPLFEFDFPMDQSGTQPVMEDEISPSIGVRRQANTRGVNDEGGPSRSRGSTGKRKQREATDDMTFSAIQEIANHFRDRSQLTTGSDQNSQIDAILDCMNIMKEMGIPQYQRTIMWH
ncbi:hypothetical protein TIFTF001_050314 [Ficus carica]|uniref:Uncharacterized protein n=1 Tax=Ficus carica TaxID=3494 RepID=A0AA88CP61_FICCA|nr:hypothetical protein TIFTF001_050312 [Ficus carica]GMN24290.1 hypothetical protein TIFTF001_050314 [Ficus carica]